MEALCSSSQLSFRIFVGGLKHVQNIETIMKFSYKMK